MTHLRGELARVALRTDPAPVSMQPGRLFADPAHTKSPYDDAGYLYYFEGHLQAVRAGRWKLRVAKDAPKQQSTPLDKPELYDLDQDPAESTNVAAEHPEVVARLMPLIERGRRVIGDGDRDGSEQRPPGVVDDPKPLTSAGARRD